MKKILLTILTLGLSAGAFAQSPLIDNPKQIKDGVIQTIMLPTTRAIGIATATLRTNLTTETTTRIAADAAIVSSLTAYAKLNGTQTFTGENTFANTLTYQDGNEGLGKFLTSDASGLASWVTVPASGDVFLASSQTFTGENTFLSLTYTDGNEGLGKVLASDASGNASWATIPAIGDAFLASTQTFTGENTFDNAGNIFYGDGSNLTGITASLLGNSFETLNSSFSVGMYQVNGVDTMWYRQPNGKFLMGCNSSNGECGGTDVDSEGIAISYPTGDSLARIKGDRIGLTRAIDTNDYYFRADKTGLYLANGVAGANKTFQVIRASSATIITGFLQYVDGNEGASKVLTSDASGNASWQTAGGGSIPVVTLATMEITAPASAGLPISVSDASAPYSYCVSTGTAAGAFVLMNTTVHCQ